jgi:para-aminobenzoate synthetase component 1
LRHTFCSRTLAVMMQEFHERSKGDEALSLMNDLGRARTPFLFVIDFLQAEPVVLPPERAEQSGILFDISGARNYTAGARHPHPFRFHKQPLPFEEYLPAFDAVQEALHRGDSYLLNLTFATPIDIDLSLEEIFHLSRAKYRLLFQSRFVVFSPETFVRIRNGKISSHPMKGTIDAHLEDAEARILNDPKELAEHTTIVDLIRNDLSGVARHVRVERFRYIDRILTNQKEILQVSSEITGRLPDDYHENLGTILFALLPAGSVTGAPKKKTVEIIRSVENYERGYYTGIMGYFDGHDLDSGVMIRFIERTASGLQYKSGGGITVFSNARDEYQEMIDKVYVPIV